MKKRAFLKLFVAVIGVVATGCLAFNILAYSQVSQQIGACEKDEQVINQVMEATKLVMLQRQLENSSNNVAKQTLSTRIDMDLTKIKTVRGEVSPKVDESIRVLLEAASKNQHEKTIDNLSLAQQATR